MQVILIDKVINLGNLGDRVTVKAGYARNFLIPKEKAIPATKKNIERLNTYHLEIQAKKEKILQEANYFADKIKNLGFLTINTKSGKEGKLFGSVNAKNISDTLKKSGIHLNKKAIRLPNGLIRKIGEHEVIINLHPEISMKLIVKVTSN